MSETDPAAGTAMDRPRERVRFLSPLADAVQALLRLAVGFGMATLCAIVIVQVGGRYLFSYAPVWSEVAAGYILVWVSFLGAAWLTRAGLHLTVSLLPNRLDSRLRRLLDGVGLLALAIFTGIVLKAGLDQYELTRPMMSIGLDISASWLYLAVPVFGVCALIFIAERLVLVATGAADPNRGVEAIL